LGKDLVLIGLLMLAGPVASHAIASAAYRLGIPMRGTVRNDLRRLTLAWLALREAALNM
jgi:multisubunit Na+/H+ antiporter MnhG subunit